MAPSLVRSRKRLSCFNCGQTSALRKDAFIKQWECRSCEAMNYLDENGDPTDPPVATFNEAPPVRFARQRAVSPLPLAPSNSPPPFCDTCINNQRLYTASLAQYDLHDQDDPQYAAREREFYAFKKRQEERYPQVCEDCYPRVMKELEKARKTAKGDFIRGVLNRTQANGGPGRNVKRTWLDFYQDTGRLFWWLGILGQLAWNLFGLLGILQPHITESCSNMPESSDATLPYQYVQLCMLVNTLIQTSSRIYSLIPHTTTLVLPALSSLTLLLSMISLPWNPKFKETCRGFRMHITGLQDWYKFQFILFITRGLFWLYMGDGLLGDATAPATIGAHCFMLGFTVFVALAARESVKVNFGSLWGPVPDNLKPKLYGQSAKSRFSGNNMGQALDDILQAPGSSSPTSSFTSSPPQSLSSDVRRITAGSPYNNRVVPQFRDIALVKNDLYEDQSPESISRSTPKISDMTQDEAFRYLKTGEIPARLQSQVTSISAPETLDSEMAWEPTEPLNQSFNNSRSFSPSQQYQNGSTLFGQPTPVSRSSAFGFPGLPAAPISPAHRLRNPPNQPRLQMRSQEVKENFFNNITGRQADATESNAKGHNEYEFAPQKFFAPADLDIATDLSNSFDKGLSFQNEPQNNPEDEVQAAATIKPNGRLQHLVTSLVMGLMLCLWHGVLTYPSEYTGSLTLGIMVICAFVALRSIVDYMIPTMTGKNRMANSIGAIFGGCQAIVATVVLQELWLTKSDSQCEQCSSLGAILMGVMMVHHMWLASFSG